MYIRQYTVQYTRTVHLSIISKYTLPTRCPSLDILSQQLNFNCAIFLDVLISRFLYYINYKLSLKVNSSFEFNIFNFYKWRLREIFLFNVNDYLYFDGHISIA